jgi:hypothetical protein
MKRTFTFTVAAALASLLACGSAFAERPDGVGPPDNSGGANKPEDPGGGGGKPAVPGRGSGDIFADQVMLWRDVDGLPLYVQVPGGVDDETGEPTGVAVPCLQPISVPESDLGNDDVDVSAYVATVESISPVPTLFNPVTNPADGTNVNPVPLGGTGLAGEECDASRPPLTETDYSTCDLDGDGTLDNICAEEVAFERLSVARSPQRVLDKQLREAITNLQPPADLSLDHAGRFAYDANADGIVDGQIDAPTAALALHQELMINEVLTSLPPSAAAIPLPDNGISGYGFLDHAASMLGTAAAKGGLVDLDLVVYNNRILDIPNQTIGETVEGDGNVGEDGELYYHFEGYTYDRSAKYPGCVTGFFLIDDDNDPSTPPVPVSFQGPISYYVWGQMEPSFIAGNVYGFAMAADDTMRVITFVHDNVVTFVDKVGERTTAWCTIDDPR